MGDAVVFGRCPICGHTMNLLSFMCEDELIYFYAKCNFCGYTTSEETSEEEVITQIHTPNDASLGRMLEFCSRNVLFFQTVALKIKDFIKSREADKS